MKTTFATDLGKNHAARRAHAFSLSEMLVVIAIVGVITALAVPILSGAGRADNSKDRRNAQNLAEVANLAIAGGDTTIPTAGDAAAVVDLLVAGIDGSGAFEGTRFQIPDLDEDDKAGALAYLSFERGTLIYRPRA